VSEGTVSFDKRSNPNRGVTVTIQDTNRERSAIDKDTTRTPFGTGRSKRVRGSIGVFLEKTEDVLRTSRPDVKNFHSNGTSPTRMSRSIRNDKEIDRVVRAEREVSISLGHKPVYYGYTTNTTEGSVPIEDTFSPLLFESVLNRVPVFQSRMIVTFTGRERVTKHRNVEGGSTKLSRSLR